jgi:putative transposase
VAGRARGGQVPDRRAGRAQGAGLKDILIAVVDGLKGFPEALEAAFPRTTVQTCIVHLMRPSLSCASYRERKELAEALKPIYKAQSAERAEELLDAFEDSELGRRYPDVVRSWRDRWELVIPSWRSRS